MALINIFGWAECGAGAEWGVCFTDFHVPFPDKRWHVKNGLWECMSLAHTRCWSRALSSSEQDIRSSHYMHSTALGSVWCRVSSLKLLSGASLMSCRPCDRCYGCHPGTAHWGYAIIALDATPNGWGKKAASWVREGRRMPSGHYWHLVTTAVSLRCLFSAYKCWTSGLSLLPPLDSWQPSYFTAGPWF